MTQKQWLIYLALLVLLLVLGEIQGNPPALNIQEVWKLMSR